MTHFVETTYCTFCIHITFSIHFLTTFSCLSTGELFLKKKLYERNAKSSYFILVDFLYIEYSSGEKQVCFKILH